MIGQQVQSYRILRQLGAGGMGVVYEAEDTRLGRRVALKFLPASLDASPDATARFEREARILSSLNHPNICTIHDIGTRQRGRPRPALHRDGAARGRVAAFAHSRPRRCRSIRCVDIGEPDRRRARRRARARASSIATSSPPTSSSRSAVRRSCSTSASPSPAATMTGHDRGNACARRAADRARHDRRIDQLHVARAGARPGRSMAGATSFRSGSSCTRWRPDGRRLAGRRRPSCTRPFSIASRRRRAS